MAELWLEFEGADGKAEKLLVDKEKFVIGRHSDCDLSIPESIISRQHAAIDRFGEVFVISDRDSSYGTKLNGNELVEPVGLKDGDSIELGGSFVVKVNFMSDEPEDEKAEEKPAAANPSAVSSGSSIPTSLFYIAPIFGLLILICAGGGIFIAFSGGGTSERASDERSSERPDDGERPERTPRPEQTASTTETTAEKANSDSTEVISTETPAIPVEPVTKTSAGIESLSAQFLRKAVKNDPNAFLTSKQIALVAPKIDQLKTSSALAANLKNARSNSAQIASIASNSGLTPLYLSTASIAKLGNQSGNVAETAKSMVEILAKLSRSLGGETADDALLVIAAYEQGVAGKFTQLRVQTEALSAKTQGVTARQVRTIWFLHEQNKLSDAEFDFALRFIAIGTIAQKPSEFGVNAEALNF
ncbi:MAG: FHA domain-containing protein [Pyrinomonadaceae bacterium]|nr:FHA domain-containing protein [Pyrinomonadaceae bacterium]